MCFRRLFSTQKSKKKRTVSSRDNPSDWVALNTLRRKDNNMATVTSSAKLAVKLPLIFFVLYFFVFLLGGLSGAAPFLATVKWIYVVDQPTIRLGFFVGDTSDGSWTFHWNWCKDHNIVGSGDTCEELRTNWFVASILWGMHLPVSLAIMILLFKKPDVAYWLAPIGFMFQLAGGSCFVLRVAPMFRELLQYRGPLTSATWSLSWAGGIAIAAVGCHFVVLLLLAYFHRRLLGLDRALENMFLGAHFHEAPPPPLPPRTVPVLSSSSSRKGSGDEAKKIAGGKAGGSHPLTPTEPIGTRGGVLESEDITEEDTVTNDEPALQFQTTSKRTAMRSTSQSTNGGGSERRRGGGGDHQHRRDMEPFDSDDATQQHRGYSSGGSAHRRRHFQPAEEDGGYGSDHRWRGLGKSGGGSTGYRSSGYSSGGGGAFADGRRRGGAGNSSYFTDEDLHQSGQARRR
jgi:hypothetical protein